MIDLTRRTILEVASPGSRGPGGRRSFEKNASSATPSRDRSRVRLPPTGTSRPAAIAVSGKITSAAVRISRKPPVALLKVSWIRVPSGSGAPLQG